MSKTNLYSGERAFVAVGAAIVQYQKEFNGLKEAVAEACELSFSLGSSCLPEVHEHFRDFTFVSFQDWCDMHNDPEKRYQEELKYTLGWDDWGNNPSCGCETVNLSKWQIGGNYETEVLFYQTASGLAQFCWVEENQTAFVRLETRDIRASSGYKAFVGAKWQPHVLYSEPVEMPERTTFSIEGDAPTSQYIESFNDVLQVEVESVIIEFF